MQTDLEPTQDHQQIVEKARPYLRRIALAFVVVVALVPFQTRGGTVAAVLLVPQLVAAAFALMAALRLRSLGRHR